MKERVGSRRRSSPHGFIGMLEASKPKLEEPDKTDQALESTSEEAVRKRQTTRRLVRLALDFNRGLPNLRRTNPELYEKITSEQHEIAQKRRRVNSNPDILDMRLD